MDSDVGSQETIINLSPCTVPYWQETGYSRLNQRESFDAGSAGSSGRYNGDLGASLSVKSSPSIPLRIEQH